MDPECGLTGFRTARPDTLELEPGNITHHIPSVLQNQSCLVGIHSSQEASRQVWLSLKKVLEEIDPENTPDPALVHAPCSVNMNT